MMNKQQIFNSLGLDRHNSGVFAGTWLEGTGGDLPVTNPSTGEVLATVTQASEADYDKVIESSVKTFEAWRALPAPKRGEYVRLLGHALREKKQALGALVSLEMGKIRAEGEGEVQEMIDICDFAVGLSPPALWTVDGFRATAPQDVRAVASARPGGSHHRIQLPGGGVVLERGHRRGLRRHRRLEAVVGDPADRRRRDSHRRERDGRLRVRGRVQPGGRPGLGRRRSDARRSSAAPDLGHRLDRSRQEGGRGGGQPVRPLDPRTGRQQRHHRHGRRQPRAGGPGRSLRRGGDGRAAMHLPSTPDRPRGDRRQAGRSPGRCLPAGSDRRPAGERNPDGSAGHARRRQGHDDRASRLPAIRGERSCTAAA